MTGPVLRAGAWPAVVGISGVAVVVGGCGAAFPAAATMLLPICFALLAGAAAFTLDEPASLVVDVTPTGPARRTGIRAVALLAPLAAGGLVMLAAVMRGLALPWAATGLALAGHVLFGFAAACVVRTRTGEPGATAGTAVVLALTIPSLVPQVARWVRTFPAPGAAGPSPDIMWWIVLAVCAVAILISAGGRRLPRRRASLVIPRRPGPYGRDCHQQQRGDPVHARRGSSRTPRGPGPGQLAMRRLTTRPDRAPVTGPAAWFIRFVGVDGVIGPLGFGGFTIPAIISVAQGRGIIYVWGNPTYGDGPFERIGVPTTVPLLAGFLAACLVQLVGAGLLIWLRPSGFVVMPAGMLLSAIFWWGFDLPLAWLGAGLDLAFLAAAWLVYTRASRKLVQRANRIPHCNQHEAPASRKSTWSALI